MFNPSELTNATNAYNSTLLWEGRETILVNSIQAAVWIVVLLRTIFGSKLPFLYLISLSFLLNCLLGIVKVIVDDWYHFGYTKGLTQPQIKQLGNDKIYLDSLEKFLYYEVHWLFAWRYWQVSETLARVRGTSFCNNCMIYAFNLLITAVIFANYTLAVFEESLMNNTSWRYVT
jgi:hypothetical protein